QKGKSYLTDVTDEEIKYLMDSGKFSPTIHFLEITDVDAVILCVPTPLRDHAYPDLSYIQTAARAIAPFLKHGKLVVLESSTFPGTTEEVMLPILSTNGLIVGIDYYLSYSPERIDPGNKSFTLGQIPKVVSGVTAACLDKVKQVYGQIFDSLVPVTSPRAAEMTKLLENSQRFINISFINEITMICTQMGIDVWEVIEAANTKPYGFTAYYPGPGIGGHCIPVDPLYLEWKAKQYDLSAKFIQLAKVINDQMPGYIVERIGKHLPNQQKMHESSILLIGITYKKDVNDVRESTPVMIFEKLLDMEAKVEFHDPFIPALTIKDRQYTSVSLTPKKLQTYHCVVILTDHTGLPYDIIVENAPLVFDSRNSIKKSYPHVIRL
ncbi:UDP-N-acetyl-D-glucosamine dehydrogenase, partial [Bradyrhizobium japonicum]